MRLAVLVSDFAALSHSGLGNKRKSQFVPLEEPPTKYDTRYSHSSSVRGVLATAEAPPSPGNTLSCRSD